MSTLSSIPANDLKRYYSFFKSQIDDALLSAAASGYWVNGPYVRRFSDQFAGYIGTTYCHPVANGTDALEIALAALITQVDSDRREILVAPNCGGYTSSAAFKNGLKVRYVDVSPNSHLVSHDQITKLVNSSTLAVVVTHLYGAMDDVSSLRSKLNAAGHHHVFILEDCAQAHGANFLGRKAGSIGDISTFSFYPTKNLGCLGDGGAILTSNKDLYLNVSRLSQYGWKTKYCSEVSGGQNSRLDELQASVLLALLPHLDWLNSRRRYILKTYRSISKTLMLMDSPLDNVGHLAVFSVSRKKDFVTFLNTHSIQSDIHYPFLDTEQPAYSCYADHKDDLPNATTLVNRIVSLPCFPFLTESELDRICSTLLMWENDYEKYHLNPAGGY